MYPLHRIYEFSSYIPTAFQALFYHSPKLLDVLLFLFADVGW